MGAMADAAGMRDTAIEVRQLADLLIELERKPVVVTEEEIARWSAEIGDAQIDRTISEPTEDGHSLNSQTMGMV
jgi:hypothetical protein